MQNVRVFDETGAAFGPTASVARSVEILTSGDLAGQTTEFLYGLGVDWQREHTDIHSRMSPLNTLAGHVRTFEALSNNNVTIFNQL